MNFMTFFDCFYYLDGPCAGKKLAGIIWNLLNYRDNFDERYRIIEVVCKRTINSKNPEAKTKEVIIMNY